MCSFEDMCVGVIVTKWDEFDTKLKIILEEMMMSRHNLIKGNHISMLSTKEKINLFYYTAILSKIT